MPEVKEIRSFAEFMNKKIKGKEIIEINILNGRYKKHGPPEKYNILKKKLPLKVIDVRTKGKFLYIVFEDDFYIFSTMGLSGGWCYMKKNGLTYEFSGNMKNYSKYLPTEKINLYVKNAINHRNIEFKTKQGSLFFYDMLSFGSIKIVKGIHELHQKLDKIGPDIMDKHTNYLLFKNQIKKPKNLDKPIGVVLLDQKTISGIGNYLRSDILYATKISPFRKVKKLTENELLKLYNNSRILTWGDYDKTKAKKMGIIDNNTKFPADYNKLFYVYNQIHDILGNKVIKKELYEGTQKRFIYYVPSIQK